MDIKIFPNPCTDFISIRTSETDEPAIAFIYNNKGKLLYSFQLSGNENRVDLKALQSGFYFCRVTCDNYSQTIELIKSL
jgi:hypothetical protein